MKKSVQKWLLALCSTILMICAVPISFFTHTKTASATQSVITEIEIGQCITLGTYLGEPIVWRCVAIDDNGPLMLSEKILCFKSFDAKGNHGHYLRNKEGTNNWKESCMRHWLNSVGAIDWSTRPATPNSQNVFNGYNAYNTELGFLSSFTNAELPLIKTITQKTYLNELDKNLADGGSSEYDSKTGSFSNVLTNSIKIQQIEYFY